MKKVYVYLSLFILILFTGCNNNYFVDDSEPVKIDITESYEENLTDKDKSTKVINVAISTMISPKRTFFLYEHLLKYIEDKLGIPIKLKQRKTYQEVNDLLKNGELDFAYVCSGAYVVGKKEFDLELLAAPRVHGQPYYQAYLIVNKNSGIKNFEQLRGKKFAFSDPLSNTGYKYVVKLLKDRGYTPDSYFSKTIFTYAHDYSIQTVARRLVEGATVDGLVYDYILAKEPERLKDIVVIHKSPQFGIPPFVFPKNADQNLVKKVREILVNMDKDPKGKKILQDLQIDSFEIVDPEIYKSIESFN